MKNKLIKFVAAVTAVATLTMPFAACEREKKPSEPAHYMYETDYLVTEGTKIVNMRNEPVYLRGINAGGLFVIEQWMTGFKSTKSDKSEIYPIDHKTHTKVYIERFGKDAAKELWQVYQDNWWSDIDFENCLEMGINCIRLPFSYMTVDFDAVTDYANAGKSLDFTPLSNFVRKASEYGIYTILDLHGAYGSQNGQDHSGEVRSEAEVDFYSNETLQQLTVNLLKELAKHFKGNPAVAAIDILNEPAEKQDSGGTHTTTTRHWNFFDKAYDAIRSVDENRIVIFESCWDAQNLPMPTEYGWENCVYSFHHYTNCTGQDSYPEHTQSFSNKLAQIGMRNFGVPLHMGEFTCYDSAAQWEYTLDLLNRSNWHWNSWTYKTWINSPWGVVNIGGSSDEKVDSHHDDYETIMSKFLQVKTTEKTKLYTFNNGKTLYEIISAYAKPEAADNIQ